MNGKQLLAAALAVTAALSLTAAFVSTGTASAAGASLAGADNGGERRALTQKEQEDAENLEKLTEEVTATPDTLESVSFASVESLIRENNLNVRMMNENIAILEELDYEDMEDQYRDRLNGLVFVQDIYRVQSNSYAVSSLQSTYDSIYQSFQDILNGDRQRNDADTVRQLRNAQDQIVMGGEALYVALLAMDTQRGSLERQLAALNRTVEEMELRHKLGQISDLALQQTKSGRSSLISGLETLKMNIRTYTMQLENMLGANLTGTLHVGSLPAVTQEQIAGMDEEADLLAARGKSYELYAAARTLEEAEDTFHDSAKAVRYREDSDGYKMAVHTWTAAQNSYNAALQSYELRFRTLYEQVKDYYQVWEASVTALETQQASYAAQELRYQQGNISQNTLLSARDELDAAEETTVSNANNLFSAYNNYCWAVQHGILN